MVGSTSRGFPGGAVGLSNVGRTLPFSSARGECGPRRGQLRGTAERGTAETAGESAETNTADQPVHRGKRVESFCCFSSNLWSQLLLLCPNKAMAVWSREGGRHLMRQADFVGTVEEVRSFWSSPSPWGLGSIGGTLAANFLYLSLVLLSLPASPPPPLVLRS